MPSDHQPWLPVPRGLACLLVQCQHCRCARLHEALPGPPPTVGGFSTGGGLGRTQDRRWAGCCRKQTLQKGDAFSSTTGRGLLWTLATLSRNYFLKVMEFPWWGLCVCIYTHPYTHTHQFSDELSCRKFSCMHICP